MNNRRNRIIIIGATSAIAEQCARLWAKNNPSEIILVGRSQSKLEVIAADLKVRSPDTNLVCKQVNFLDANAIQNFAANINTETVDIVLIAHGSLPDQKKCKEDLMECKYALEINAISPVLFAESFAQHMKKADHGTIAIIGSVAGDRGRMSNYIYGSAKGLVSRYAQGMQHQYANSGLTITLIKPGPTDTPMTSHLKAAGKKLASPEVVAKNIVDGISKNKQVIYTPAKWQLIMLIIQHLPRFVFNKIKI